MYVSNRCSICVSGVCLTATELTETTFKAGLAPETLRRTYLGDLTTGDLVNLERASIIGGRNSGHFVQGHVDGTGSVLERWVDKDSLWYKIQTSKEILKYIVPKGFIAVDGTSLTVVDVNPIDNWFTFMLVEYTQKKIIIPSKVLGDAVNLEVDILGKYSDQSYASILLRLESLEAQVEKLERTLSKLS
jgi:riboflavin synthase